MARAWLHSIYHEVLSPDSQIFYIEEYHPCLNMYKVFVNFIMETYQSLFSILRALMGSLVGI